MFIRNQWYGAAWDKEVGRTPLARTICGEPVVVYRKLDGSAVALEDACPHRLLPLALGKVEGDGNQRGDVHHPSPEARPPWREIRLDQRR